MDDFIYPRMPAYTLDQMAYMKQMHDWHMTVITYHEQKRMYHEESAKHFKKMMDGKGQTRQPVAGGVF